MIKDNCYALVRYLFICSSLFCASGYADENAKVELENMYRAYCQQPCDINEHIPVLKGLAQECPRVIEIGVRSMVATWGLLQGLTENESLEDKTYLGIDLYFPLQQVYDKAESLAKGNGISFDFWAVNDMDIEIPTTDLLFIDSLHTYCHLSYELDKFSSNATKYIALHDTSAPWGDSDDIEYLGDYSEYPNWIDRTKRGLWPAVEDFLAAHPEWTLHKRLFNNHGFTILKRVDESVQPSTLSDNFLQSLSADEANAALINELASRSSSVAEIGGDSLAFTWEALKGLSTNSTEPTHYIGVGLDVPGRELSIAKEMASDNGINSTFWNAYELCIAIETTDLLLINNLQTYCHVTNQLENFASNVVKYIAIFHTKTTEKLDDPSYEGDYSEYPAAYDRDKRGVWTAIDDFVSKHPEWILIDHRSDNPGVTVLQRIDESAVPKRLEDPTLQHYLDNKIILCTGPSLGRYDNLKYRTEADLSLINFKKIFVSTNDPSIMHITFNGRKPDGTILLENQGKQLDCFNCIITSLKAAVNDPDVEDDDIIMFKHESVFLNDMGLVKRAINKMIEGTDLIVRTGMFSSCTDHFYVKVSAVKEIVKDHPIVTSIYYSCEDSFNTLIVQQIRNAYNIFFHHSLWKFTQLGAFHVYPGYGAFDSETDGWGKPWWNKSNYDQLYN